MDPHQWQRIRSIFEEATDYSDPERLAFVQQACGDDQLIYTEVLAMLEAHDDEQPFLESLPADEVMQLLSREGKNTQPGARIGAYKLIRELGHGGMGSVYLAERADGQYEQKVAIKLVRHGQYQEEVLRRFQYERQILASLHHPNIARLFDSGVTDTGLPYLVMEYIEGVSIDRYCDQHQLTTTERLDLFRVVCEAVHYAHQNLIIHRDLKPSNILVSHPGDSRAERGIVKLLDFGIARLIDYEGQEGLTRTRTGLRLMTPEYASPEQVRGEPVTTSSDLYALGVILYELLSGHRPYEVRGLTPSALEQVVCEQDPQRPSTAIMRTVEVTGRTGEKHTLSPAIVSRARSEQPDRLMRRLKGDLDNIVMMALHKESIRRYNSVAQMGEDIRRHLVQLPVLARPDRLGYRLNRFIRRHRMGVLASVLVLMVLLGGIIATIYQARVAERNFNDVRALANTLLFELHDELRDLPGAAPARQRLVTHALTYLDKLNHEAGEDVSLQLELAEAYERIGLIQGDPHYTNLGDMAGTRDSYTKAFILREELWRSNPTDLDIQHALANSYARLAVVSTWGGDGQEGMNQSQRAVDLITPVLEAFPANVDILHDAGRIRSEWGWNLIWSGQKASGLAQLDTAITQLETLSRQHPEDLYINLHLWRAYSYQVDGYNFTKQTDRSRQLLEQKGLPLLQVLARRYPVQPRVQYGLHICYTFLGEIYTNQNHFEKALSALDQSLKVSEEMVATDSTNRKSYESLARAQGGIAYLLGRMNRIDEAARSYEDAIGTYRRLYRQNPQNREIGNMIGNTTRQYCRTLLGDKRYVSALRVCQEGVVIQEEVTVNDSSNTVRLGNLGSVYAYMGRIYRGMAHEAESQNQRQQYGDLALSWYNRSLDVLRQVQHMLKEAGGNWEVHPDSLSIERDIFARGLIR